MPSWWSSRRPRRSGSARARRWPRASAIPPDTPEGCWDDLSNMIAPGLLGRSFGDVEDIAAAGRRLARSSRFAAAGAETALWDLLGQARHASIAELLGASDLRIDHGRRVGPGRRALSQHRRADQDDRGPPRGRLPPGQDQDPARPGPRAGPGRPPALRRPSPDGRRQRGLHGRRPRRLPRARRA